jgi:hypothetical protein
MKGFEFELHFIHRDRKEDTTMKLICLGSGNLSAHKVGRKRTESSWAQKEASHTKRTLAHEQTQQLGPFNTRGQQTREKKEGNNSEKQSTHARKHGSTADSSRRVGVTRKGGASGRHKEVSSETKQEREIRETKQKQITR